MPVLGQDIPRALSPVAILGPGLIGGSLGLALRRRSPELDLRVWSRRRESADAVTALGFASTATCDLRDAVSGAATVVLCTPVELMPSLAASIVSFLDRDTLVTDVGSVKQSVIDALEPILGSRFVGAHPVAGSEKNGLDAAREDLFDDAPCVITPTSRSDPEAVDRAEFLWTAAGARVVRMTPAAHDSALARTSHLPHLLAAALVNTVSRHDPEIQAISGGGYRDTTRIASGSPEMWAGILLANRDATLAALDDFIAMLDTIRNGLDENDAGSVIKFLKSAREKRDELSAR
jgi:prephenate dehydrogenase